MFSVWKWRLVAFSRKLWVRASLYALLGVVTALVAAGVQGFLPSGAGKSFGAGSVDAILTILASSMLAVTTFSLGIMVSALSGAAQAATPRAVVLLMQDGTTQNVLATFLGTFLFSLVGIIALKAGLYGAGGRLVLFIVTLVMVAVIVLTMLRWIAHLSEFGRMRDVLSRVERAAEAALAARLAAPYLGGHPRRGPLPDGAHPVFPDRIGYVQHLDTGALESVAEGAGVQVHVAALPGAFVDPSRPLAHVVGPAETGVKDRIAAAFTIGQARSFEQDPRFGLQVLAEVASRALSPAVNDPGTAIDVLGRAVRLIALWGAPGEALLKHPHIWVPEIAARELFEDVFRPIARDGASLVEVQIRLQKALATLARLDRADFGHAAARQSDDALARAEAALAVEADREILRDLNVAVRTAAGVPDEA
ncbi:DUF2254 domain-containing protein [Solirhodobacter olei]|uniref:DUF2254 domain-containing protein n=1 Tax=Solirhodobacter olei TaxID=2493082 RepID=UPI000FDAD56F|nr:DUF2254 domain-containing protein [Solirhodobacter olei]